MKRYIRITSALCIIAALLVVSVGCNSNKVKETEGKAENTSAQTKETPSVQPTQTPPKETNLRFYWWGAEAKHKWMLGTVDLFKKKYPYIKVECEYQGFNGYFEKLLVQLAAKNAPDLIQMSYALLGEYVARNQMLALDDYISKGVLSASDLPKDIIDAYKSGGKTYALPSGINSGVIYYNKDMFDKAGVKYPSDTWTWDEFLATAKTLTKDTNGDGKIDQYGTCGFKLTGLDLSFIKLLYERGGKMWNDNLTKVAFNSPQGKEVFNMIQKMYTDGIVPPPELTASNPQGLDDFQFGRTAMSWRSLDQMGTYKSTNKFNYGMTRMPVGSSKKALFTQPSAFYVINSASSSPNEAAMLMNYMLNDDDAWKAFKNDRGIPVNAKHRQLMAAETTDALQKDGMRILDLTMKDAGDIKREPFPPSTLTILDEMGKAYDAIAYNKKTVDQALKDCEDASNKILDTFYSSIK